MIYQFKGIADMVLLVVTGLLCVVIGAQAQLNPLGRFGKCVEVPTADVSDGDMKGLWYTQYRPENPDHYVHSCQAQYEQRVGKYLTSLLYFYNKNEMVNDPQNIQYGHVRPGKYYRTITTDGRPVRIYANVLALDPKLKYRVVYYCADDEQANPNIFNVGISTRDMNPRNVAEVLYRGEDKVQKIFPQLDFDFMRVDQEGCVPLDVESS